MSATIVMAYFIIVRGPLGVGKSTVSGKLAKILHAEYVSVDRVLEKRGLAKTDSDYTPGDFIKANEYILPGMGTKLRKGKIVVFDGAFYFRKQIGHLIQNLNFPSFVFTLTAPLKVCVERDRKRKNSYGKEATTAVYKLVSRFDYGIAIDTNKKDVNKTVREILSYLPKI